MPAPDCALVLGSALAPGPVALVLFAGVALGGRWMPVGAMISAPSGEQHTLLGEK